MKTDYNDAVVHPHGDVKGQPYAQETCDKEQERSWYSIYALAVLVMVNVFILIDRQILGVLAEDIKADLGLTDAQIGFIYGAAISVFYAIFSIPLGRFADVWVRKNLLACCVAAWSLMIFLTGTARTMVSFAIFRAGVGVGEAGAAPPAMSMIGDYFSPKYRATALSVFAAGVPIGGGLGLFLGGWILESWNAAFPEAASAPLGLAGWQAAFFVIAIPGPFLAAWLWTLREPVRGQSEGISASEHVHPFREVWHEIKAVLPIINLFVFAQKRNGIKSITLNLFICITIIIVMKLLSLMTGTTAQWIALGLGFYCITGWMQNLHLRDPIVFTLLIKCRSLTLSNLGVAGFVFIVSGVAAWIVPFMIRVHGVSAAEAGAIVGIITAVCGFLGNVGGGLLSDFLERYTKRARIYVLLLSLALTVPSVIAMVTTHSKQLVYVFLALFYCTSTAWYGVAPAIANSLVMPRMRGISSAFYLIVVTLLGVSLGPYTMGFISDAFIANGATMGDGLRMGMLWSLLMVVPTAGVLILAGYFLPKDMDTRLERARASGEHIATMPNEQSS